MILIQLQLTNTLLAIPVLDRLVLSLALIVTTLTLLTLALTTISFTSGTTRIAP